MCHESDCNRKWPGGELTLNKARAFLFCHVPVDASPETFYWLVMSTRPRMCPNDRKYLLDVHLEDKVLEAWRDGYAKTAVSNNGGS